MPCFIFSSVAIRGIRQFFIELPSPAPFGTVTEAQSQCFVENAIKFSLVSSATIGSLWLLARRNVTGEQGHSNKKQRTVAKVSGSVGLMP